MWIALSRLCICPQFSDEPRSKRDARGQSDRVQSSSRRFAVLARACGLDMQPLLEYGACGQNSPSVCQGFPPLEPRSPPLSTT